jgi:hypothetical protein
MALVKSQACLSCDKLSYSRKHPVVEVVLPGQDDLVYAGGEREDGLQSSRTDGSVVPLVGQMKNVDPVSESRNWSNTISPKEIVNP